MKKIAITFITAFIYLMSNAQVINVCGTDSIKFQLDNYDNGIISWQESIDTTNWITIPNATEITYIIFPEEQKYYRAVIKTSICEALYSPIAFVQLPPKANAGVDRYVSTTTINLFGNKIEGAVGNWSLIHGNGTIVSETDPRTEFIGSYGDSIALVWTQTNACGQSKDTVSVVFEELQTNDNFIVVDNTDIIYSDSIELGNGIYKIQFSDPEIVPYDSAVLIGIREEMSFIRNVLSFTFQDSIYTIQTEQASIEDLFYDGVFSMGEAVNQSMTKNEGGFVKGINGIPTRKTISEYSENKGITLLYTTTIFDDRYPELMSKQTYDKEKGFMITLPDLTLFQSEDSTMTMSIKDAFVSLDPNFVLDFRIKVRWWRFKVRLKYLCIGVDNAEFKYGYTTAFQIKDEFPFFEKEKTIYELKKRTYFMAGAVPVSITTNIDIVASCSASASGELALDRTVLNTRNLTALIQGYPGNFELITAASNRKEEDFNFNLKGSLNSDFQIGPEISFLAYGIVGPYLAIPITAEANVCANILGNWNLDANLGIEGTIGARAKLLRRTIFDLDYDIFSARLGVDLTMPYKLELMSGYNQNGYVDSLLAQPLMFKVTSNYGFPVPLVMVHVDLEDGNGSTDEMFYFSDLNGMVYIDWTLGENPLNKMKVYVMNCDNEHISSSPIYVYANSTPAPYNCEDSDLSISMVTQSENLIPNVSGGTAPYQYSTDGLNYSNARPSFNISNPGEFTVYAKDTNECIAVHSFNVKLIDICANSGLDVKITNEANSVEIQGANGTQPYLFAIDSKIYTNTSFHNNLNAGEHIAFIKDANECTDSVIFEIKETYKPLLAIYPTANQEYVPITETNFEWIAGNYAITQVYDLFLKKEGQAYNLLSSNITEMNYLYTTNLDNGSIYYWKIVVKDENGLAQDTAEFTFSTENSFPILPEVPVLIEPTKDLIISDLSIMLKWTKQTGDFVYDVYFDDTDASNMCAMNLDSAEFTVSNLENMKTYYWKVKIKSLETSETEISPVWQFSVDTTTLTDFDGNIYQTINIGSQKWMKQNLATTHYSDGTPLASGKGVVDIIGDYSTPYYFWYNDDSISNAETYGALYTWSAMMNGVESSSSNPSYVQGVCPCGWHLPSDNEWKELEMYLGMSQQQADTSGFRGTNEGSKLAGDTSLWNDGVLKSDPEFGISEFMALPGGYREPIGTFNLINSVAHFSVSTEEHEERTWRHSISLYESRIDRGWSGKDYGFSVRCVENDFQLELAEPMNEFILDTDSVELKWNSLGNDYTYNIYLDNSDASQLIEIDLTDTTFVINNLQNLQTYYWKIVGINKNCGDQVISEIRNFSVDTISSVSDYDGNIYKTVNIGKQKWMKENLKSTHYADGTEIPIVTGNSNWLSLPVTEKAYCYYDDDSVTYANTYGVLYNWAAVMNGSESSNSNPSGVQGVCPDGWHLPSESEWNELFDNLGGYNVAGKKMKEIGDLHWSSSNNGTDESGFTALPGGKRECDFGLGNCTGIGTCANWWSSTKITETESFGTELISLDPAYCHPRYMKNAFSTRCIKDD